MTLEEAKKISDNVINTFAQKPRNEVLCESQLHGRSFFEIHSAFALVIALSRQLGAYDPNLNDKAHKQADLIAGLVTSFPMSVIPDEVANRLSVFPKDSDDYKKAFVKAMIANADKWHSNPAWGKLETLNSFNQFCWTLDPKDSLYWQKIYTHLGLPYDSESPKGLPNLTFEDNARESWVVPKNSPKIKSKPVKVFLLIAGIIAVIWFLLKH